jgi:hypothetical protein
MWDFDSLEVQERLENEMSSTYTSIVCIKNYLNTVYIKYDCHSCKKHSQMYVGRTVLRTGRAGVPVQYVYINI